MIAAQYLDRIAQAESAYELHLIQELATTDRDISKEDYVRILTAIHQRIEQLAGDSSEIVNPQS